MSEDEKNLADILFQPLYYSDTMLFSILTRELKSTFPDEMHPLFISFSQVITERLQFHKNNVINAFKEYESIISEAHSNGDTTSDSIVISIAKRLLYSRILEDIRSFSKDNQIQYYINICKNYNLKIESLSHLTTNKCIVDPLGNPISDITNIRIDVSEVNDWMLNELKKNPTDLYQLSSRRFEELVAEILIRKGYSVELTQATRDGGKDIYAARKDDLGSFLYVVECKKYNPNHKVGVNVLRDLYGVLSKERATYGVAVTTSYFSKPAQEFQQDIYFKMALHDFESIKKWLCDVT